MGCDKCKKKHQEIKLDNPFKLVSDNDEVTIKVSSVELTEATKKAKRQANREVKIYDITITNHKQVAKFLKDNNIYDLYFGDSKQNDFELKKIINKWYRITI